MTATEVEPQKRRPASRLSVKLLIVSSLVTVLGFTAVCGSIMLDMRRGEEELARQTAENLAATIDADISSTIESANHSLRVVATNLASPQISSVSRELRQLILFGHGPAERHLGAVQVFDAAGKLTIDASTLDPIAVNVEAEEFFRIHRDNADAGLFISRPALYRSAYSIVLSRRITGDNGSFLGIVAGAIRFSYFHDLFSRFRLGDDDTITLLRRDGIVIMRKPFDLDAIGKNLNQSPLMRQMLDASSGSATAVSSIDGIGKLFVWRDSGKELIVVVGKPWASVYRLWQKEAWRIAAIMASLIVLTTAVTLFLAREIGRRARAEDQLEELATTDALTGLRNRRKFDQALQTEWRRAERNRVPLALLMIDADHFKSYNDRFGHQAGDQALIAIAGCIAASARRAGECAARYGGEEFALLLPSHDISDALQVAENVRRNVGQWTAGLAPLTVSIGVSALTPGATQTPASLLRTADEALYIAKANGRNQSQTKADPAASHIALVA